MTPLLRQAFTAIAALPPDDQDMLALRLLDELAAEEAFDQTLAATGDRLAALAVEALAEFHAGEAAPLDPERLLAPDRL